MTGVEIWSVELAASNSLLVDIDRRWRGTIETDATLAAIDHGHGPRAGANAALRLVLARHSGRAIAQQAFGRLAGGKPTLPGGPHFSLSHTNGRALIAISEQHAVGVDIEARRCLRMTEMRRSAIERAAELIAGAPLPPIAGNDRALQAWVRLEALAKATGEGIGRVLERTGARPGRLPSNYRTLDEAPRVTDLSLEDGYFGAVAIVGAVARSAVAPPVIHPMPTTAAALEAWLAALAT